VAQLVSASGLVEHLLHHRCANLRPYSSHTGSATALHRNIRRCILCHVWLGHHCRYVERHGTAKPLRYTDNKQDIIASGLTHAIRRPFPSKYTWRLQEQVLPKEVSDGGPEVIEPIIDTQIHQRTHTL
jgi:hypothetical protein